MSQSGPSVRLPPRRLAPREPAAPGQFRRNLGLRARGQLPVVVHDGYGVSHCHAVDLSPSGLLLDRGREVTAPEMRRLLRLQLFLPGQRLIRATARPVRRDGHLQGVQLVAISDVDRLGLGELIDGLWRSDPSALH